MLVATLSPETNITVAGDWNEAAGVGGGSLYTRASGPEVHSMHMMLLQ
jgi:hypothetical protein